MFTNASTLIIVIGDVGPLGEAKRYQRDEEATDIRQHVSRIGEDGNGP